MTQDVKEINEVTRAPPFLFAQRGESKDWVAFRTWGGGAGHGADVRMEVARGSERRASRLSRL